ncbi:hypothetical protein ACFLR2_00335 [Chlamydiota bacterium]
MTNAAKSCRFAFHHQNEALLFQFLLHECISAQRLLRQEPCPERLRHVIGYREGEQLAWQALFGHLPRMRHYCALFETHFAAPSSPLSEQLSQALERAHSAAQECLNVHEKEEKSLAFFYPPLISELSCFLKLLFEKLSDYRDNPSVLYFLLRHQEECDAAYCEPVVKKMFSSFFPQGSEQAQAFLTEQFSHKGFDHLIPSIEEGFKKMDASLE